MAGFKDLKGQGHAPTLFMAFLYFDMSFMVWTMLGPLSTEIAEALALAGHIMTAGEKATLLSLPILSGAILRIVLGFGVDKFGAKKTALVSQLIVIASLITAYILGNTITYNQLLIVALGLGFAGASFAVALPQAGQWYPPKSQGIVMGIAGAGNIGVVIDFLFAPKIAELWGWDGSIFEMLQEDDRHGRDVFFAKNELGFRDKIFMLEKFNITHCLNTFADDI